MRQGDYAAYTAHMAAEAPKLEDEWQAWLGGDGRTEATPYCRTEPRYKQYGYIASVVLGSLNHADDVNLGYRLYDETVTLQVGSTVELRVTTSKEDPGTDDVNRVEAWIDWNGNGRFDESTEQVMDAEALLTN